MTDHVVILGGGFAGLEAAKRLGQAGVQTTLVDQTNHHLFQPLLYQVATAALSAPEIAEPIRKVLRRYKSVNVVYGEATDIDATTRTVSLRCGTELSYSKLIVATGAVTGYRGQAEWQRHAPGLKTVEDARAIRSRLLLRFEEAEKADTESVRRRLMTFVVIGGGPTGVELAGSIAELARFALARDFRHINPKGTRVILLEGGRRLLSGFDSKLSDYAQRRLDRLGVTIKFDAKVSDIGPGYVMLDDRRIEAGLTIWAAGVASSPLGTALGVELDRTGRVPVDETLHVSGLTDVFVLGDLASAKGEDGQPLPGLAQVAKQQGEHLGRSLASNLQHGTPLQPFRYRSRGNTAIIGRHAAIFEYQRLKVQGWPAWLAWALIHVYLLVGFQHRLTVSIQWLWRYLTFERGARLIAGSRNDRDQFHIDRSVDE